MHDFSAKYKVRASIEKYNTREALEAHEPDEIFKVPGNILLNEGINHIWAMLAYGYREGGKGWLTPEGQSGGTDITAILGGKKIRGSAAAKFVDSYVIPTNAFVGVGNAKEITDTTVSAEEVGLGAADPNWNPPGAQEGYYCYVGMNYNTNNGQLAYPISGQNQKITFQATFLPGIACFNWYEWTVSIGNGNPNTTSKDDMKAIHALLEEDPEAQDQTPDPKPEFSGDKYWEQEFSDGAATPPYTASSIEDLKAVYKGVGQDQVININCKREQMGKKYITATWIVTIELSLS